MPLTLPLTLSLPTGTRRSADYFLTTGGVAFVVQQERLRSRLQGVFERDWASRYAHSFQ